MKEPESEGTKICRHVRARCIENDLRLFRFLKEFTISSFGGLERFAANFKASKTDKPFSRQREKLNSYFGVKEVRLSSKQNILSRSLMEKVARIKLTLFKQIELFLEFGHFVLKLLFFYLFYYFLGKFLKINLGHFGVFGVKLIKFLDRVHDCLVISLLETERVRFSCLLRFSLRTFQVAF